MILNNHVDEVNIDSPIKQQINTDLSFLVDPLKNIYRTADIFMSEVQIKTDYGISPTMINSVENIKTYTFDGDIREQTLFMTSKQNNVADFYIRKSQTLFIYDRKLGNILTILSYLGGIWSTLILFASVFMKKYNESAFFTKIGNKLYNFPFCKYQSKKSDLQKRIILKFSYLKFKRKT